MTTALQTSTFSTLPTSSTTVHAVEIITPDGPVICSGGIFVNDLRGARRMQKAMAKRFPSRILLGGQGGIEVE